MTGVVRAVLLASTHGVYEKFSRPNALDIREVMEKIADVTPQGGYVSYVDASESDALIHCIFVLGHVVDTLLLIVDNFESAPLELVEFLVDDHPGVSIVTFGYPACLVTVSE